MHLDENNELTCTHSIAECATAVAAEARRHGADYVVLTWDYVGPAVVRPYQVEDVAGPTAAIAAGLAANDPFQNGEWTTLPAWYVERELTYRGF